MAWIGISDLQFSYSWSAIPPDDARVTGKPDSTVLNRNQGYEVLAFLKRTAKSRDDALKTERMIKQNLPAMTRSHADISRWLSDNWAAHS